MDTRYTDLIALASWASVRAVRPRPGDILTKEDARKFAAECRARAHAIGGAR